MTTAVDTTTLNLGFLTIFQEAGNFLGGYLVTNQWGRPLEFRLTSAVQPNRVQQILYSGTLEPYICADLIGKTLVEKTPVPVNLVVTDSRSALDLRLHLETPVAWVAHAERISDDVEQDSNLASPGQCESNHSCVVCDTIHCHRNFPEDAQRIEEMLDKVIGVIDLSEPFQRIREAMSEARRMGIKK